MTFAWIPYARILRWLAAHPGFVIADNAPGHHGRHSVMVFQSRPKQVTAARADNAPAEHNILAVG